MEIRAAMTHKNQHMVAHGCIPEKTRADIDTIWGAMAAREWMRTSKA